MTYKVKEFKKVPTSKITLTNSEQKLFLVLLKNMIECLEQLNNEEDDDLDILIQLGMYKNLYRKIDRLDYQY